MAKLKHNMKPTYQQAVTTQQQALLHVCLYFALYTDQYPDTLNKAIVTVLKKHSLLDGLDLAAEVASFKFYKMTDTLELEYFKYLVEIIKPQYPKQVLKMATEVSFIASNYQEVSWYRLQEYLAPYLNLSDLDTGVTISGVKDKLTKARA